MVNPPTAFVSNSTEHELQFKICLNDKLLNVLSKGLVVKYVFNVDLHIIKNVITWIYLGTLIDGNEMISNPGRYKILVQYLPYPYL